MEHYRPADIERTSMALIQQELTERGAVIPPENAAVIKRVIHTTADFEFADLLRISPGAVQSGIAALSSGTTIVTDTNMALAGISRPGLRKLNGKALCYMADENVAKAAKARGTTRAVVSVERAAKEHPACIYAVGNAPTALFEIVGQMRQGFHPALVIGVPVGFVNVTEAKEQLMEACRERDIPYIVTAGRKGGSTVAAAICNALIYQAADLQDPMKRGW